jgi:hypothetical protein
VPRRRVLRAFVAAALAGAAATLCAKVFLTQEEALRLAFPARRSRTGRRS